MNNVCALVLAHNEEAHLPTSLKILNKLKREGTISKVIVVDDGSTDNTKKIAEKLGAIVISHKENLGRRAGFISGAKEAQKQGAEVIINIDADAQKITSESIKELIEPIIKQNKLMSIGKGFESHWTGKTTLEDLFEKLMGKPQKSNHILVNRFGTKKTHYLEIGEKHSISFRAIKLSALNPLFMNNKKWTTFFNANWTNFGFTDFIQQRSNSRKWGLEKTLDILIPKNKVAITSAKAYYDKCFRRKGHGEMSQQLARQRVEKIIKSRREKANKLKKLREKAFEAKSKQEAKKFRNQIKKIRNKI